MMGTASLLGIVVRAKRQPDALVYDIVSIAFRQAFLLSLLATGLVMLQGQRLVSAWAVGLGFLFAVAAEAYMSRRDMKHHLARMQARTTQKRGDHPSFVASPPPPVFTRKELEGEDVI